MNSLVRHLDTEGSASPASFRQAMRQLAGGVSIVTVGRGDAVSGLTVTSVTSLSAEPPTLLVCVNRGSSSWPLFESCGAFAVSVLDATQQAVADRFAGRGGLTGRARFEGAQWTTLATGVPVLAGALAAFDCAIDEIVTRHSHAIVIGRVVATRAAEPQPPLTYWQGDYVALHRAVGAAPVAPPG